MYSHVNSIAKMEAVLSDLNTVSLLSVLIEKDLDTTDLEFAVLVHFGPMWH